MAVIPHFDTSPEAVPLALLRRYLVANNWRTSPARSRQIDVNLRSGESNVLREVIDGRTSAQRDYERYLLGTGGQRDIELIIPRDQQTTDFINYIEKAIRVLSGVEGREPSSIIAEIRMIGFDVVRSRIPNSLVQNDTIHLEIAASYVTGVKSLLASTATTEIQPDPFFLRLKKEGMEFADRCRFAHTFRGSFGFSIESPVAANNEPTLSEIEQTPPFERLVMERFARGVRSICNAVDTGETADLVENAKKGFGANSFELFAKLIEETSPGGMEFDFIFSPEWRPAFDLREPQQLLVGPQHAEISKVAAKLLRSQFKPRPGETIFGRVVRLANDSDPSDLMNPMGDREVAVAWGSEDLGDIHVRVSLGAKEYLQALHAHGAGRPIKVSGTLERRGRLYVLIGPTDFIVP